MVDFNEKFNRLYDKICNALSMDGKTSEIIEVMNYNIKKGLLLGTEKLGDYCIESGLATQNPIITGIGVFVNSNKDGFRDVLIEKNNIEYLDKKIKEECRNRPHRNEYKAMSSEEQKIDDALWRRKQWIKEGLNDKRKLLGYDRTIEWALDKCKQKEEIRVKFARKIDIDEKQFDMLKQSNLPNGKDANQYEAFKLGKLTFGQFLKDEYGEKAKKLVLNIAKNKVKEKLPKSLNLGLSK